MNTEFDFYDRTNLKSYNLDANMRYQLNMLDRLDVFTRKHCENVAALTCRLFVHIYMILENFLYHQKFYKNLEN